MLSMSGHGELSRLLRSREVKVRVTASVPDALRLLKTEAITHLIIDQERGFDAELIAAAQGAEIWAISRVDGPQARLVALEAGVHNWFAEPISVAQIADLLAPLAAPTLKFTPRVLAYARGAPALAALRELISPAVSEVIEATDGMLALSGLQNARPDLIVLDVTNELKVTALHRLLRADPLAQTVPIVLLADHWSDEFAHALGRFDHLLTVPIEPKMLHWQIARVFADRVGEQAGRVGISVGPTRVNLSAPITVPAAQVAVAESVVAAASVVAAPSVVAAAERLAPEVPPATVPSSTPKPLLESVLLSVRQDALKAIEYSQMRLNFQPIVSLRGDGIERYEALLRLPGSDNRTLDPSTVFAALRGQRAALLLDRWVLGEALTILRAGSSERLLFVNLSLDGLTDLALLDWLAERMSNARISPSMLIFDVGLEQTQQEPERVRQGVRRLKNLGCRACLQDTHLLSAELETAIAFGMNFIKLNFDGPLAEVLAPAFQTRLKSAAIAAHAAQVEPIACRVESPKVLPLLWSSGIELVQGYITQAPSSDMSFDFAQPI